MEALEGAEMTILQLWYLFIFGWGMVCGWAVVSGFKKDS